MNKNEIICQLGQNVITVGDLKKLLENRPDDMPVVVSVDGGFGYASYACIAFGSTWDAKRVWVTENPDEENEFVQQNPDDLIEVVYLKCLKPIKGE